MSKRIDTDLVRQPKTVMFFPNGNTAAVDGEQIPGLQASWFLLYVEFLAEKGVDPTQCEFLFPGGARAHVFRIDSGWNWGFEPRSTWSRGLNE